MKPSMKPSVITKKSYNFLKIFTLLLIAAILLYPVSNLQAQEVSQETTIVVNLSNPGGVEFEDGDMWKVVFIGSVPYNCLCGGDPEGGTEEIYSELLFEVTGGGKEIEVTSFEFPVTSCSIETDEEGNFIVTASVEFYEEISISGYNFEGTTVSPAFAQGNWDIAGLWVDIVCSCTLEGSGRWFAFKEGEPYPPIPIATYYPSNPLSEEEVTFDGSNSFDLDGEIVKYEWDFGDGDTAEGVEVTHAYSQEEEYTVVLTVTDDDGLVNSGELIVDVGQEKLLIIDQARTDKEKYSLNEEVSLSCEVSDESGEEVSEVVVSAEVVLPDNTPDDLSDNPKETVQLMESETTQGFYKCEEPFASTNRAGKYFVTFNAEKEDYTDAEPVELNFIIPVQIVLTFDDGPDGVNSLGSGLNTTENIIDDLDYNDIQNGIKAAFFVQTHDPEYGGSSIGEELIEIEDEEGHIIGVHTGGEGEHYINQDHTDRVEQNDPEDIYDANGDGDINMEDGQNALECDLVAAILRIKDITGQVPEFVRPPYWEHNQEVLDAYKSYAVKHALGNDEGLKMIYRDVLSRDGGATWPIFTWSLFHGIVLTSLLFEVKDCIEYENYQMIVSFHDTNAGTAIFLSDPGIISFMSAIVGGVRMGFGLETKEEALEYTQFIISTDGVLEILRLKEVTEVME